MEVIAQPKPTEDDRGRHRTFLLASARKFWTCSLVTSPDDYDAIESLLGHGPDFSPSHCWAGVDTLDNETVTSTSTTDRSDDNHKTLGLIRNHPLSVSLTPVSSRDWIATNETGSAGDNPVSCFSWLRKYNNIH
ncbi:hypothetical protein RSOLAG1IB_07221 [Rhizoctonia solani AG-1 IB]|uniref:Uncharacterized protein n=1 Tax=Thanatephorus cucumeris (strain AG1-IB / isolate 7/3/14) TaxID=1108050 RepID=A0A0B7FEQ1_THACB|nr:hypothetical protein RSOLAG1IB_07221 [Rhizoctonia solani AG-1 IB]